MCFINSHISLNGQKIKMYKWCGVRSRVQYSGKVKDKGKGKVKAFGLLVCSMTTNSLHEATGSLAVKEIGQKDAFLAVMEFQGLVF